MELKLRRSAVQAIMAVALLMAVVEMGSAQICNMSQEGMAACKPCIATVRPVEKPTDACCSALKQADLKCLCNYKNSELLPYLGINPDLAMQLPAKCNITPSPQC